MASFSDDDDAIIRHHWKVISIKLDKFIALQRKGKPESYYSADGDYNCVIEINDIFNDDVDGGDAWEFVKTRRQELVSCNIQKEMRGSIKICYRVVNESKVSTQLYSSGECSMEKPSSPSARLGSSYSVDHKKDTVDKKVNTIYDLMQEQGSAFKNIR
jgi:hypothetical protein